MGFFNFPHTRTYDTDLGWIIKELNRVKELLNQYLENAVITFADPITWNITEQYTALTCVIDSDGTAYLSKQPVPAGVDISNTNYWLPIFNYDDNINQLRSQIAYNAQNRDTTGVALSAGDLVFWNGLIYEVTADMPAGTAFIIDSNIRKYTVDEKINAMTGSIHAETAARIAADEALSADIQAETEARTAADTALAAEIREDIQAETEARTAADTALSGDIQAEEAARVAAIDELRAEINNIDLDFLTPEEFGAVGDGVADDSDAIQAVINAASAHHKYIKAVNTYIVSRRIILADNTIINGYKSGKFLDRFTPEPSENLIENATFSGYQNSNIYIIGMSFESSGTREAYEPKYGYFVEECTNINFVDCFFRYLPGVAAVYARNCDTVNIISCICREYSRGAFECVEGTSGVMIARCHIINGRETASRNRYPIMLCGYDQVYDNTNMGKQGNNLYCCFNVITDDAPMWEGIDAHGGQNVHVFSNRVMNTAGGIAIFTNMNRGFRADYVYIHDNYVYNSNRACVPENTAAGYGNAFGGNYVYIYNNTFRNGGYGYQTENSAGVYFDAGIPIFFKDNMVSASYGCALKFAGDYGSPSQVMRNFLDGVSGPDRTGIDLSAAHIVYSMLIYENIFTGAYEQHIKGTPSLTYNNQYVRLQNNKYFPAPAKYSNISTISPDQASPSEIAQTSRGDLGDICYNSQPAAGSPMGWIMTGVSHYAGTWRALPNIT